jgi:hypothetical protein
MLSLALILVGMPLILAATSPATQGDFTIVKYLDMNNKWGSRAQ